MSLVSIIIPTYNHKSYVCDAIESGLNQTYPHVEIVVIDDGSTDGTGDLLKSRYGDRIHYIYQENKGVSATRNNGFRHARGEFVQPCDADDQLLPTKIARCMSVFAEHPEYAVVYTQCHHVESDGRTIMPREQPELPSGNIFCELLTGPLGDFVAQSTTLIRREAILDVGGQNETMCWAEDWDLWLRLAARHPFGVVNEPLVLYRMLPTGAHADPVRMREGRLAVIQMARHYPGRERCLDDAAYDRLEAGRHHALAMALWEEDRHAEARHHFDAAIQLAPDEATVRRLYRWLTYLLSAQQAQLLINWGSRSKKRLHP